MGRTTTEVRDKLKELHAQVESGVRQRRHYMVNDALAGRYRKSDAVAACLLRFKSSSRRPCTVIPEYET